MPSATATGCMFFSTDTPARPPRSSSGRKNFIVSRLAEAHPEGRGHQRRRRRRHLRSNWAALRAAVTAIHLSERTVWIAPVEGAGGARIFRFGESRTERGHVGGNWNSYTSRRPSFSPTARKATVARSSRNWRSCSTTLRCGWGRKRRGLTMTLDDMRSRGGADTGEGCRGLPWRCGPGSGLTSTARSVNTPQCRTDTGEPAAGPERLQEAARGIDEPCRLK